MPRYVDADAMLQEARRLSGPITGDGWDNWGVYALIQRQPTADVVERRTGKWEEVEIDYISDMDKPPEAIASMFCPVCKRYANTIYFYGDPKENMNYCPYCGAKMEVGQDEQH